MTEPADSTAAISTASVNAKPSPTSRPSMTSPASASGSVGMCWPCSAIGARPIEMPTAMIPRTCGGIDLRGEQRRDHEQRRDAREHEDEAGELVARELAQQLVHEPTIVGIEVNSAVV